MGDPIGLQNMKPTVGRIACRFGHESRQATRETIADWTWARG